MALWRSGPGAGQNPHEFRGCVFVTVKQQRSVAILLATYNGQSYLREQIESIVQQDYQDWRLYVRDDGSTDETIDIVRAYAIDDERVVLIEDESGRLGPAHNFAALLEIALKSGEAYISLADQDDVWESDKLSLLLSEISAAEDCYGDLPLLCFSDLSVADRNLNVLNPSFMSYQHLRYESEDPLQVLLVQNFVTGCAAMFNRRLLETALPVPRQALMHDWWLALCAAAFGRIAYVNRPLAYYRQHGSNEVGAKSLGSLLNPFKTNWFSRWREGRDNFVKSISQASALAGRIGKLDPANRYLKAVEAYASLSGLPDWKKIGVIKRYHIHCQSRIRHYLMLSRLLLTPGQRDG